MILPSLGPIVFILFGLALFVYSHSPKPFSEELLIFDLMWLDGWALAFFFVTVLIWQTVSNINVKVVISLLLMSIFLVVATNLLLNGTPYYLNGYWGDQQFRQAMILKFATFNKPGDFYYKGLPIFYPPLYYYFQSIYARAFSVEAFKMAKIGQTLIFAFAPIFLFYFWRRIVSPLPSFFITMTAFLYCNYGNAPQFFSPHTFLAYSFFIPWWLYYVEQLVNVKQSWKFYFGGGLIGACIFLTYIYVLAIGAAYLVLRMVVHWYSRKFEKSRKFSFRRAGGVIAVGALFTSPYWLPLLISIFNSGLDRSRGGWYHIGYTGLDFQFLQFSAMGLIYLAGIIFLFRRPFRPLNRSLLIFVAAILFIHLIGSILGGRGIDINSTKSSDIFIYQLAGPVIGLLFAAWFKFDIGFSRRWRLSSLLACVVLLVSLNNIVGIGKSDGVKTARTADIPTWNTNMEEMKNAEGSVFLLGYSALPSFYPIYTFFSTNEHYAHPASQYFSRYKFLYFLQQVNNPAVFNTALRHNKFERIDYFMPYDVDGKFGLPVSFSNYPNGSYHKTLRYERKLVQDTALFTRLSGDNLYRVNDASGYSEVWNINDLNTGVADSLIALCQTKELLESLDEKGKEKVTRICNADWSKWHDILLPENGHAFSDSVLLSNLVVIDHKDSLYFLFTFLSKEEIKNDYKVMLHLVDSSGTKHNLDFVPARNTNGWKKWDFIMCGEAVPKSWQRFKFSVGLYLGPMQLGETFNSQWYVSAVN